MAVRLVTVDQFLEKAGLDAAAVPDTEVIGRFILERDLDEYIFGMIPAEVVRRYAEHLLAGEPIGYGFLLEGQPQIELGQRDPKDVTHLAVVRMQSGSVESLLVDRTIGRAYYSRHGFVLDDVCYAEKAIPLTDERTAALAGQIAAAGLPSAGAEYTGDTDCRMYTVLLLAFEDGVVQYISRGMDSGMPQSITGLCRQLLMQFSSL